MAHQLIHTSCKRGINNKNDGFQVYSFDSEFLPFVGTNSRGEIEIPTFLKNGNYELPTGTELDENSIQRAPKEYAFENQLDENRLLYIRRVPCKDYSKESGRWGNVFKHYVICSPEEVRNYPTEFYDSKMLRYGLTTEEANSSDAPGYLPSPEIVPGVLITENNSSDFISVGDRSAKLRKMICALLTSEMGDKKIIICDTQENIIQWIAAIEYILPLNLANKINFTTYTKNPEFSCYWICGVTPEGTLYDPYSPILLNRFYVFDFIHNIFSDVNDDNGAFYDSVESTIPISYDRLKDFHEFLDTIPPLEISSRYADAYALYELSSFGLESIDNEDLKDALSFMQFIGDRHQVAQNFLNTIKSDPSILKNLNNQKLLIVLSYLVKTSSFTLDFKDFIITIVTEKLIDLFLIKTTSEEDFRDIFSKYSSVISKDDIIEKLLNKQNLSTLLSISGESFHEWKGAYLEELYYTSFKVFNPSPSEFLPDKNYGLIYSTLLSNYLNYSKNSYGNFVMKVLSRYNNDIKYISYVVVLLDAICDKNTLMSQGVDLWSVFNTQVITSFGSAGFNQIIGDLLTFKLYNRAYSYYSQLIVSSTETDAIKIFDMNFSLLEKDNVYGSLYLQKDLDDYWKVVEVNVKDKAASEKSKLIKLHRKYGKIIAKDKFNQISTVTESIPLTTLSDDGKQIMDVVLGSYLNDKVRPASRTLLLSIGYFIEKCSNLKDAITDIREVIGKKPVVLSTEADSKDITAFFKWLAPLLVDRAKSTEEIGGFYSLFEFSHKELTTFAEILSKEYYKTLKSESHAIVYYINFISNIKEADSLKILEKYLLKELSRKDVQTLSKLIEDNYSKNKNLISYWKKLTEKETKAENDNKSESNHQGIFSKLFTKK